MSKGIVFVKLAPNIPSDVIMAPDISVARAPKNWHRGPETIPVKRKFQRHKVKLLKKRACKRFVPVFVPELFLYELNAYIGDQAHRINQERRV